MRNDFLRRLMHILVCVLLTSMVLGGVQLVRLQAQVPVGDPYTEQAKDASMVLLDEQPSLSVNEKALEQETDLEPLDIREYQEPEEQDSQDNEEEQEQDRNQDGEQDPGEDSPEDLSDGEDQTPDDEKKTDDAKEKGEEKNDDPNEGDEEGGGGEGGTTNPIETDATYFTTSIKDGETVTDSAYSFTITHTEEVQKQNLTPESVEVLLNGETVPQFGGTVILKDGENQIMVKAVYSQADGKLKTVGKTYTVFLNRGDITITDTIRNLAGKSVYSSSYSFEAYAMLAGEQIPLTVLCNGEQISGADNQYTVSLNPGANAIELSAPYEGYSTAEAKYEVYYDQDLFEHNLADQDVETSGFSFFARLKNDVQLSSSGRYAVMLNGTPITNDSGEYTVELQPQNNTIRLRVTDAPNGIDYEQNFNIYYQPPEGENAPTISTNLDSNPEIKGKRFLLQVEAYSYTGQQILATGANGSGLTVLLNGNRVDSGSSNTTYDLYFNVGDNQVQVRAQDEEGYYSTVDYTVYCADAEEGDVIGTATISVEASTVGLGYLIPPTQVEIHEGENAAYEHGALLEDNGYELNYSGTPDNGFYLAHLIKGGISSGAAIPDDLMDKLEQDGIGINDHHADSLGEHDFTNASGWMYQIDGETRQNSLSECYLLDGQTLRLRFTLAGGRDIGAAGGANYDKEW